METLNIHCFSLQPNLEFLDASYNRLVTLEGLRGLGQLKQLDVRWNKLTNAREDTAVLRKHTPALLKLDTRYNPWNRVCSWIKYLIKSNNIQVKLENTNCIFSIYISYVLRCAVSSL